MCFFPRPFCKQKKSTAISFMEGFKKVMLHTKTSGELLSLVRQALVVVKWICFHRGYGEMPFPKMLCSIVVVQLFLWPELGSTEDAWVHLQLTRLNNVSASSYSWLASAWLWATHHTWCRLGSLDHDLTSMYSGGVSSHMAAEVSEGWYHLQAPFEIELLLKLIPNLCKVPWLNKTCYTMMVLAAV